MADESGIFWRAVHTISRSHRAAKHAALSTHNYPQEGGKLSLLDPSAPSRHYQQEGYPDTHFSPQEGESSDENPSKSGGVSQPDVHFSQK